MRRKQPKAPANPKTKKSKAKLRAGPGGAQAIREVTPVFISTSEKTAAANSLTVAEEIQRLPPELREKIYKEYLAIKLRQRNEKGWAFVHGAIENAPFCDRHKQIAYIVLLEMHSM